MKLEKIVHNLVSISNWIAKQAEKSNKPARRQILTAIANKLLDTYMVTNSQLRAYSTTMQEINKKVNLAELLGFVKYKDIDGKTYDIILSTGVVVQNCTYAPAKPTDSVKYQKGFMSVINDATGMRVPLTEVKGVRLVKPKIEKVETNG